ncbi:MAG: DUF2066 domain-containing protein [Geminicoccaceae bacterium]
MSLVYGVPKWFSVDTLGDLERFAMFQSIRFAAPLISICLVLLGGWLPALAQSSGLYTVSEIAVDATADDALVARKQARLDGQRIGLRRLLERLVPANDHGRLPNTGSLPVERYVQNFQIADEKVSNTRYLATMTVTFDPEGIRELLRTERLAFSEETSVPLVVLPLYDTPGGSVLWPENNPWWAAWADELDSERALRLVMPLGDLEDVSAVTIDQARNGDLIALRRLASRYGAKDAIVVSAAAEGEPAAGGPVRVRLAAQSVGRDGQSGRPFTLEGAPGEPLDVVLRNAVNRLQNSLDEQWKQAHLLRLDTGGLMFVQVPISNLGDWVKINQGLENLPEVSQVEITSFARRLVEVQIYYVGDELGFEQALTRLGLTLSREGDSWRLLPIGTDPRLSVPPSGTPTTSS